MANLYKVQRKSDRTWLTKYHVWVVFERDAQVFTRRDDAEHEAQSTAPGNHVVIEYRAAGPSR